MISFVSRGNGYLAPLIGLCSAVIMIPAQSTTVKIYQTIVTVVFLVGGAWVVWYGTRTLLAAQRELGRALKWYEWVFDPVIWKPRPFHSFMMIQMPWWGLGYAAAVVAMVRLILR